MRFRSNIKISILFICCLRGILSGLSQTSVSYYQLGIADGLSDLTINTITQDSMGILYFGTQNGLNVYDGNHIETYYSKQKRNTISSNTIFALYVDNKNRLWIGNNEGIDIYHRRNDQFKSYKFAGRPLSVRSFFQDSHDRIWVGTFGRGLHYYDNEKDSIIPINNSLLKETNIACIAEDIRGNIWFGTYQNGLFIINKSTLEVFSINKGVVGMCKPRDLSTTRISTLCPDKYGNIYIGTFDQGLYLYDFSFKQIIPLRFNNSLTETNSHITGLLRDTNDNIWIASDGEGIFIYDVLKHTIVNTNNNSACINTLSTKAIRSIFFDKTGTLWIGTYQGGINYTYETLKKSFSHNNLGFKNKNITSIVELNNGRLLAGTDGGGLYEISRSGSILNWFNSNHAGIPENVLCIHQDHLNNIWIGSYTEGLVYLGKDLGLLSHFMNNPNSVNSNDIRSVVSDSNIIFIATHGGGLNTFDRRTKKFSYYSLLTASSDSDLTNDFLGPLFIDSQGYLWIGTLMGAKRYHIQSEQFINLDFYSGLDRNIASVNCIYEDSQGYMWFGTNQGLHKLNTSVWESKMSKAMDALIDSNYTFSQFLNPDSEPIIVNSILEDNLGNLWLGTNKGLIRFNINEEIYKRYYPESGINIQLFNARAAYKSNDGTMYFGGNDGLISFKPEEISDMTIEPELIISQLFINLKKYNRGDDFKKEIILEDHINYTDEITLKHGARVISIQFGSTNSYLPKEIEYAYKLDNFDENWNYTDHNNQLATYTNLAPGYYNLQIKARYSNSDWNSKIRNLSINISPPYWKTWAFRIGLTLLTCLLLYLLYLRRVSYLRNHNLKLEKLVSVKSDQLLQEKEAKLKELENNKQLLIEKQDIEKERLLIEKEMQTAQNEKLSAELELKNQKENAIKAELSASLAQISKKNDLLKKLRDELSVLVTVSDSSVSRNLSEIIQRIESETYFKEDWHKFETHFNAVYADFIHRLKIAYPNLTRKDLRLCSYLKMNLSTNEIARLSNITLRGVEKSRSRLRKKLNLSSEDNLNDFFLNL